MLYYSTLKKLFVLTQKRKHSPYYRTVFASQVEVLKK